MKNEWTFVIKNGIISYVNGHYVKRMLRGKPHMFFRTEPFEVEIPERYTHSTLTPDQIDQFVDQENRAMRERLAAQAAIHPEDHCEYVPLTFEQIISDYRGSGDPEAFDKLTYSPRRAEEESKRKAAFARSVLGPWKPGEPVTVEAHCTCPDCQKTMSITAQLPLPDEYITAVRSEENDAKLIRYINGHYSLRCCYCGSTRAQVEEVY